MSILLLVGLGDSCSMDAVLTACMKKKRSMMALEPLRAFQSTRRVSEQMYFIEVFFLHWFIYRFSIGKKPNRS